MALRVLKFGGTSVETPVHVLAVARRILTYRESGDRILVVVSAMGQSTDELVHLAHRVCRTPPRRELDMLLTAGERISMALLAMALQSQGCPAISFTGSQSGIVTDSRHNDARIHSVRPFRIEQELDRGKVVIVAGFQGVSPEKEVTTLGRGGSDTTAVALAIRFGAERCEIYTDVDGVLSADPRVVSGARLLPEVSHDAMVTCSHFGGRVLYRRAVLLARKYRLPLVVRSSLHDRPGTRVAGTPETRPRVPYSEETEPMESDRVLAVALESPVCWARVLVPASAPASPPGPGEPRRDAPLSCLLFSRTRLPGGDTLIQWVGPKDGVPETWLDSASWGDAAKLYLEKEAALLTLVGGTSTPGPEVARIAEARLEREGIPIWWTQTGSLALSLLVPAAEGERGSRILHRELVEAGGAPG